MVELSDRSPLSENLTVADRDRGLDAAFTWLVRILATSTIAILVWMGWVIGKQAWPAIQQFGLSFFTSQDWDIGSVTFGALTYIYGTIVSSTIALLIAVPVGLAIALITSENFLPPQVRSSLAFVVELIAAIPSVIVGLWGIFVLLPCCCRSAFGSTAISAGFRNLAPNRLARLAACGLDLAVMTLPRWPRSLAK
ncbi:MAG: phosphate ABC transporter permease subunit PstC, partial [Leptolyngbyaceae cyanobacterium SM1_3_5]|nr:phosphate ABC transporter permease subunit PstC [Leptolyngbyaceae cyanobacterium SM1_3_5]